MSALFRTKSIDELVASSHEPARQLKRTLGPWSLACLGVGIVIGSGIFTVTGTATAGKVLKVDSLLHATVLDLITHGGHAASTLGRPGAGPAITISFLLVMLACIVAGLCYAELASMIPVAGSSYTLRVRDSGRVVRVGDRLGSDPGIRRREHERGGRIFGVFAGSLDNLFGFHLPPAIAYPMFPAPGSPGGVFNIPALVITLLITWVLVRGVRESTGTNTVMVLIKIAAILIFCIGASRAINPVNYHPFAPNGFSGILTGASIVFFTYIGFDAVSTAAEECKQPQKDLPFGIMATLVICTILYGSVALVLTGIANWQTLDPDSPVAVALKNLGYNRLRLIVSAGALMGMISSLLVGQYGQARIWFAMSRDRLMPKMFSAVHSVYRTPHISTWIAGIFVGVPAGLWDIDTLSELSNIGTLFAFVLVSAGVIVLRKKQPDRPRSFRVPFVPLVPILSIVCCVILMMGLPLLTWIRFFVWLAIGLVVYFTYSQRHAAEA